MLSSNISNDFQIIWKWLNLNPSCFDLMDLFKYDACQNIKPLQFMVLGDD